MLRQAGPDLSEEVQFSIITKAVRRQAEAALVLPLRRFLVWTLAPVRRVSQRLRRRLVALQKMPPENLQLDPNIMAVPEWAAVLKAFRSIAKLQVSCGGGGGRRQPQSVKRTATARHR